MSVIELFITAAVYCFTLVFLVVMLGNFLMAIWRSKPLNKFQNVKHWNFVQTFFFLCCNLQNLGAPDPISSGAYSSVILRYAPVYANISNSWVVPFPWETDNTKEVRAIRIFSFSSFFLFLAAVHIFFVMSYMIQGRMRGQKGREKRRERGNEKRIMLVEKGMWLLSF